MDWEAFYARFREPNFIPGYEIQNRLGGGAFGEVYKARKASIGKAYAIKFLRLDDDAQRDAALRELEQVSHFAAIDHPNLVTIEDMGTALGVPYLIMGYAGEDTLARRMRAQDLEPIDALSYFVQVCRGVLALHDRRLVHFDLKPSNVFLKGEVARVGDYGLSKMMVDGRLTLSFGRGTPQYMAPEMFRNRADHRADIYSLGVILYESIVRKLPFESVQPGGLLVRDTDDSPEFPAHVPERLRTVITRCLRLSAADRYASVADLLGDLDAGARPVDPARHATPARASTAVAAGASPDDSDVRQTAAELARGAALVARGVWEGLTSARVERSTPPRAIQSANAAFDETPRDVLAMHGLDDAPRAGRGSTPRALVTSGGTATIPVPPASTAGVVRTIAGAVELAFQVLVALLHGIVGWVARPLGRGLRKRPRASAAAAGAGSDAVHASGPARRAIRLVRGALKLALFLLVLALLGGLTTFLAVSFFT